MRRWVGVELLQGSAVEVVVADVERRFAPVHRAPFHVHAHAVGVVGENLVEGSFVFRLEDGSHAGGGVGGAGIGLKHMEVASTAEFGVGRTTVAVELEVRFAGRLADDEDDGGLGRVDDFAVGQTDLFHVFVAMMAGNAQRVDDVGPRHDQSAQLGVVASYPQRLIEVHQQKHQRQQQRTAADDACLLPVARLVLDGTPQHEGGGEDAEQHDEAQEPPVEEAGGFAVAGVEDVGEHRFVEDDAVGRNEIDPDGVQHLKQGDNRSARALRGQHQEVGEHERQGEQHDDQCGHEECLRPEVQFGFLAGETEEREVVAEEVDYRDHGSEDREWEWTFHRLGRVMRLENRAKMTVGTITPMGLPTQTSLRKCCER